MNNEVLMKRIKENQSEQGILFSNHYVGDRLSKEDEVFLFKKLFDKLDITAVVNSYSNEGGKMFSPRDQLAVIVYAFHNGVTSSVKMAELVRTDLRFIYLAGGHIIKRRTICDFRIKHRESIRKIFESSIKVGIEAGVISDDNIFALDGSKVEAHASFSKTRKKAEWEERQKKIVEHVDKYLKEWEEQDELEEDLEEKRNEEFKRIKKRLDAIKEGGIKVEEDNNADTDDHNTDRNNSDLDEEKDASSSKESKALYKKNKISIKELEDTDKFLNEYDEIEELLINV